MDLFELPPIERAALYRHMAEEMRSRAAIASTQEARSAYLTIAVEWLDMADGVESQYGKFSAAVEAPALALLLRRLCS
jgi:hypothetical protein